MTLSIKPLSAHVKKSVHFGLCKRIGLILISICGLLLSLELFYRTWLYVRTCRTVCYDIKFFAQLDAFHRDTIYDFLAADPTFGYSPADGTFINRQPGGNGAKITIHEGVRVNPDFAPTPADGAILAVGGSSVFGDKVSDDKTWPSILERRLNRRVVNGGVSGFGPMQAVMRAEHLLKAQNYSLVILSISVAADLSRDRYVNFSRFHRPAVIREEGRLRQTTVEDSSRIVSENFACAHPWLPESFFWSHLARGFFVKLGYDGHCTNIIHPKAASTDGILELAIDRVAALPVNKIILIQYPYYSFDSSIDEARKIQNAAKHHGVRIIDMYNVLTKTPLLDILKSENEVVADWIAARLP